MAEDRDIPLDRVLGCLLAGAVGDAVGAPVEFMTIAEIRAAFGPDGTTGYADAYGGTGLVTDDTQMTMFTLEAVIRADAARRMELPGLDIGSVLQHAYQRWYHTQGIPWHDAAGSYAMAEAPDGWLAGVPELYARRAPGNTVLGALRGFADGAQRGTPAVAVNDSKGCGAVMRAAPCALWHSDPVEAFVVGALSGALTHGHPSGYLPAGALAYLVHRLFDGADLRDALEDLRVELLVWPGSAETVSALDAAFAMAARGRPDPEDIADLGGGWVGEEALAIGVCAALVADDVIDGLLLAVNHSGDSDSTGSICGNLLGAVHGVDAIPSGWLDGLELRSEIEDLARDAVEQFAGRAVPGDRYPAW